MLLQGKNVQKSKKFKNINELRPAAVLLKILIYK